MPSGTERTHTGASAQESRAPRRKGGTEFVTIYLGGVSRRRTLWVRYLEMPPTFGVHRNFPNYRLIAISWSAVRVQYPRVEIRPEGYDDFSIQETPW